MAVVLLHGFAIGLRQYFGDYKFPEATEALIVDPWTINISLYTTYRCWTAPYLKGTRIPSPTRGSHWRYMNNQISGQCWNVWENCIWLFSISPNVSLLRAYLFRTEHLRASSANVHFGQNSLLFIVSYGPWKHLPETVSIFNHFYYSPGSVSVHHHMCTAGPCTHTS